MSTHKNIDRVCIFITILAILVTVIFMNGTSIGIAADDSVTMDYADKLFDDSYVHTIDIQIDDWDSFIENATSEEYSAADVVIDGETIKNVGIRGKGNTSLSTVSQLGSERYSMKIEFDAYQSSTNYYGLDKLCLNNLIQDYTMMKDYLAYKLMYEFGADAPLVSYTYVTVNGEDWGLFLAVEAVEDSFLERNNGTSFGELYKPDTMSMGGGPGNGGDFDMKDMDFDKMGIDNPFEKKDSEDADIAGKDASSDNDDSSSNDAGSSENDADSSDGANGSEKKSDIAGGFGNADFSGFPEPGSYNQGNIGASSNESESGSESNDSSENKGGMPTFGSGGPGGDFGGFGGFGMGSDDAKLKYIDDDTDSYSTIFDSAKTNIQKKDKKRLINALKNLSEGIENQDSEQIAEAIDIDEVMRYMVVHNFVVNGDSYTGSMIHNYYLYEEDGVLSMIPWDYNLAYGTFTANDATGAVNDPIDTPLSITEDSNDRPMFTWITSCDEYLEMYHEYYAEFIEKFYTSGYMAALIDTTYNMIREYVDKDPTKFCTTEEFDKGVETLKAFVELRSQSIQGQLDGTIGSTDSAQKADSDALIDASSINLSDMGSMAGGGGPGGDSNSGGFPGGGFPGGDFPSAPGGDSSSDGGFPGGDFPNAPGSDGNSDGGFPGGGPSGDSSSNGGFPGGGPDFSGMSAQSISPVNYIYLAVCGAALLAAIAIALTYKGRR